MGTNDDCHIYKRNRSSLSPYPLLHIFLHQKEGLPKGKRREIVFPLIICGHINQDKANFIDQGM